MRIGEARLDRGERLGFDGSTAALGSLLPDSVGPVG